MKVLDVLSRKCTESHTLCLAQSFRGFTLLWKSIHEFLDLYLDVNNESLRVVAVEPQARPTYSCGKSCSVNVCWINDDAEFNQRTPAQEARFWGSVEPKEVYPWLQDCDQGLICAYFTVQENYKPGKHLFFNNIYYFSISFCSKYLCLLFPGIFYCLRDQVYFS